MLLACSFIIFGKQQNGDFPHVRVSFEVKQCEQQSGYGGAVYESMSTLSFACVNEVQFEVPFQSS
jgi:hypothetical protein